MGFLAVVVLAAADYMTTQAGRVRFVGKARPTRGTLTRSSLNDWGLLAQPSRRQSLLSCVSALSVDPLGAVVGFAPLDHVLR
jgi:hypothetical protein